jgi:hypothetical protein
MEEFLGVVFPVWATQRLYNKNQRDKLVLLMWRQVSIPPP